MGALARGERYTTAERMGRCLLILVVALLVCDASGLADLAVTEPCTFASATEQGPDNGCTAFCVRCSCCALPLVHAPLFVAQAVSAPVNAFTPRIDHDLPAGVSPDILHVPKSLVA